MSVLCDNNSLSSLPLEETILEIKEMDGINFARRVSECEAKAKNIQGFICVEPFYGLLLSEAKSLANERIKVEQMPIEHCKSYQTRYDSDSREYHMWALSLLSLSWICEVWRRKARDRHCNECGTTGCEEGRILHKKLRQECIKSLTQLISQMEIIPEEAPYT